MPRFACVILVDPQGRVLLQERDEHPAIDPDTWSLCGGHVEPGEDVEAAAYRELEEETGVRLPPGTLRAWRVLEIFHEAYGSTDPVHVFVAGVELTDADITCHEGRQIRFVRPDEIGSLPLSATGRQSMAGFLGSPAYRTAWFAVAGVVTYACAALVDRRGWLLLQERDEHAPVAPEQWSLPGGGLEDGESFGGAARRELAEETGVDLPLAALTLSGHFEVPLVDDSPAAVFEVWAAGTDLTDADVECHEGRQMVFVDPAVALTLSLARPTARWLPDFLTSDLYRKLVP